MLTSGLSAVSVLRVCLLVKATYFSYVVVFFFQLVLDIPLETSISPENQWKMIHILLKWSLFWDSIRSFSG